MINLVDHQVSLFNVEKEVIFLAEDVAEFISSELDKVTTSDIQQKDINSLVSYVDQGAERMLVEGLSKLKPKATFITEEETVASQTSDEMWIIDPLDGTNNFLHKVPHFSISIAYQYQGETLFGLVYDVMRRECFYAIKGKGAYVNSKRINVSSTTDIAQAFIATGFPYSTSDDKSTIIAALVHWMKHARGIRRFGSAALDLAYVACGRFDCYYETSLNIWDVAAGILLVEEAGGTMTDYAGGNDHLAGNQILATNGHLHEHIREVMLEMRNDG